jgi:mannose-6-phosphate isomerase-like protein (cupin superfamily)
MTAPIPPFSVQAGAGIVLATPIGGSAVVKADTGQTGGSMSVVELVVGCREGPALHRHQREDELWVVVDGTFRFKAGDEMLTASTGAMAFGPRGLAHCFQNVGDEPCRLLVVTTPAGPEGFFRDFAAQRDPERLAETGLAYGLEFVGPPFAVSD